MSNSARGFTLIEMIIAIVIIGVGIAGVLAVFGTTVRSSADPLINKQMLALAEQMMEEIQLKPYVVGPGTITGCNRSNADDIGDYAGYNQPACGPDGSTMTDLAAYSVSVALDAAASLGGLSSNVTKITVTVSRGADSFSLVGWRTNFAS